ncbi:MAG: GTPase RsgA, partial [Clostridia bacterium]|nr:GTPase RsgA [Clostridia bacterium]
MIEKGRVVQIISGKFSVKVGKTTRILTARGKLKRGGATIAVGDEVEFDGEVIEIVLPRKNYLSRPSVANVDIAVIVAAPLPETDLYLVDKFISCCFLAGVKCVIAVNKSDESTSPLSLIYENYSSVVEKIFSISAKTKEGLGNFVSFLKGKTAVFSGQSAVGKTSIL